MEDLLLFVEQKQSSNDGQTVLSVKPFRKTSRTVEFMSGFHILNLKLSDNENNWMNVAFSRYYGIKGIRMTEENPKDAEISNVKNVKTESDPAGFQCR